MTPPGRRRKSDAGTRGEAADWVRNAADERALAAGMRFDPERAAFACWWMEEYCRLYEGDKAGEPLTLLPFWRDYFSRLFGWVRWSDDWGGMVRRFTHSGFWSAKKNGKSPMAAAYNLYLLAAEGEPGQKVYMMAGNSKQARIAQTHAVMMVAQSPALNAERGGDCKVNRTTLDIVHLPTSSKIEVVAGDDKRSADKKHGYNGSVTVDEMHVVNRLMMEAVGRAGLSRREPLQTSFSTAGTDPTSIGAERFKYGRQVNSGERDDPHFLHVEYCAPDDATEADIEARLEEFGRAANPAWGAIIKPGQFVADWRASKVSQRTVAVFMQERLNRWVGSTQRWLDQVGWEKGGESYTLADLAGRDCFAALDLSRTRDMTAFVLCFPWPEDGPEVVRLWPMFWLPEQTARERDHLFPYLTWAKAGALKLTPGGTVDYDQVEADIRDAIGTHRLSVLTLFYDEHYANEITQSLHEGRRVGQGVNPGVVAARVAYAQTLMTFSPDCKEFERRVSAGLVRHPRNPVLTWQVGHCEVWSDRNQNIRPVKPSPNSGKSVDGVVSAVMTFPGVRQPAEDGHISPRLLVV